MSAVEDFNQNISGIFGSSREGTFDFEAFKTFAEKNGVEQAKGYLQAVQDLQPLISGVARGDKVDEGKGFFEGGAFYISGKKRSERAWQLLKHVEEFLEVAASLDIARDRYDAKPGASTSGFSPE